MLVVSLKDRTVDGSSEPGGWEVVDKESEQLSEAYLEVSQGNPEIYDIVDVFTYKVLSY